MPVFSARDMPGRLPPNWILHRQGQGSWNLQVNTSPYPIFRQRVVVLGPDFRQGDVYVELADETLPPYPYPLGVPLDRVLFVNIVTHGLGVMLHACGVVLGDKGYIFAGPSNAGKTTMARLWAGVGEATVLGDECLILRRKGDRFWVYGTPWAGEANLFCPLGVPIEGVFFIRHSGRNLLTPIPVAKAAEQLLAQTILTPYDVLSVQYGLDFCLDFVREVPACDFGFFPDESAVRTIQRLTGHG